MEKNNKEKIIESYKKINENVLDLMKDNNDYSGIAKLRKEFK